MNRTTRIFRCSPEDVFDVLADGWIYAMWVVGAARIRDVDPEWPAPGSRIHHSVGAWPLMLSDTSSVEALDRPRMLDLTVRAWPAGKGKVRITCEPVPDGVRVSMEEDVVAGPFRLVLRPVRSIALRLRNAETLRRLAYLAEGRARKAA